jgi:uncharacterized surface protein with fasciclin (FAS1) repeats
MNLRHVTSAFTTLVLTGAALGAAIPSAQSAEQQAVGTRSLARLLAADGNRFDQNARDFDILDRAVRTVLRAKPDSPVAVLKDGRVALTAFAPTDQAFRLLAEEVSGRSLATERRVYRTLAELADVNTTEQLLLYHAVPGKTLTYRQVRATAGKRLRTGTGAFLRVRLRNGFVTLVDADRNDANARVLPRLKNLNRGNRQIAHGIDRVLRPFDLP